MVHLSQTANPSDYVRNRAKKMWVRTIALDSYIVKPKEKGKPRRVVNLLQGSRGITIECVEKATGKPCPANQFGRSCGHVEAALNRLLINIKREANRKQKQQ